MCKSLLVEDFESVLCAFKREHKNRKFSHEYIKLAKSQMDVRMANVDSNTFSAFRE